jgi:hypothetical protein
MTTISMKELQQLLEKYHLTRSGSKKEVALRLWDHRSKIMLKNELKRIEDYLDLPSSKRYKGPRIIIT